MRDWSYLTLCVALFEISKNPATYLDGAAYKATNDYKLERKIRRNFERIIKRAQNEYSKLPYEVKRGIDRYQNELLTAFIKKAPPLINLEAVAIQLWFIRFKERGNRPLHESLQWAREVNIDYIYDLLEKSDIPYEVWCEMVDLAYKVAWVI